MFYGACTFVYKGKQRQIHDRKWIHKAFVNVEAGQHELRKVWVRHDFKESVFYVHSFMLADFLATRYLGQV